MKKYLITLFIALVLLGCDSERFDMIVRDDYSSLKEYENIEKKELKDDDEITNIYYRTDDIFDYRESGINIMLEKDFIKKKKYRHLLIRYIGDDWIYMNKIDFLFKDGTNLLIDFSNEKLENPIELNDTSFNSVVEELAIKISDKNYEILKNRHMDINKITLFSEYKKDRLFSWSISEDEKKRLKIIIDYDNNEFSKFKFLNKEIKKNNVGNKK